MPGDWSLIGTAVSRREAMLCFYEIDRATYFPSDRCLSAQVLCQTRLSVLRPWLAWHPLLSVMVHTVYSWIGVCAAEAGRCLFRLLFSDLMAAVVPLRLAENAPFLSQEQTGSVLSLFFSLSLKQKQEVTNGPQNWRLSAQIWVELAFYFNFISTQSLFFFWNKEKQHNGVKKNEAKEKWSGTERRGDAERCCHMRPR